MLSAGVGFVDKPDEHLPFSHYLIGKALSWLNSVSPSLPWYSLYLLFAQFSAMTAMLCLILQKTSKRSAAIIVPLFFLAVCLHPTQLMQFTSTGMLLCSAGALYLLEALERKLLGLELYKTLAVSLLFMISGAAIRYASAKAVVGLSAAFLLCWLFTRLDWPRLKIGFAFLALCYILTCAIELDNAAYYAKTGWSDFYRRQEIRFSLTELGRTTAMSPQIVSAFKTVKWSPADNNMLNVFYILDQDTFALDKLERLNASVPARKEIDIGKIAQDLRSLFGQLNMLPTLLSIGIACLLIDKHRFAPFSTLFFLTAMGLSLIGLEVGAKLPIYVFAGFIGYAAAVLLWAATSFDFSWAGRRRCSVLIIGLAALLVAMVFVVRDYRINTAQLERKNAELKAVFSSLDRRLLYVAWAWGFPGAYIRPFDRLSDYFQGLKLIGISYLDRSPGNLSRLTAFGINDLLGEIDKKELRLISSTFLNDRIQDYILQHYGKQTKFQSVCACPDIGLQIYKVGLLPVSVAKLDFDKLWSDYLVCRPSQGAEELILFPEKDDSWKLIDLQRVKKPFYYWVPGISTCQNCKVELNGAKYFQTTGRLPTLSYRGKLEIHPELFSNFFIELAAPAEMNSNRLLLVEFNLSKKVPRQIVINLKSDNRLHRYEFDLAKLGLAKGELLSEMNVHPVYLRAENEKTCFVMRRFGFVRRKTVSN